MESPKSGLLYITVRRGGHQRPVHGRFPACSSQLGATCGQRPKTQGDVSEPGRFLQTHREESSLGHGAEGAAGAPRSALCRRRRWRVTREHLSLQRPQRLVRVISYSPRSFKDVQPVHAQLTVQTKPGLCRARGLVWGSPEEVCGITLERRFQLKGLLNIWGLESPLPQPNPGPAKPLASGVSTLLPWHSATDVFKMILSSPPHQVGISGAWTSKYQHGCVTLWYQGH